MKKYIVFAFTAIALTTTAFGVEYNQNSENKCICNQTEICTCLEVCDCSSCKS